MKKVSWNEVMEICGHHPRLMDKLLMRCETDKGVYNITPGKKYHPERIIFDGEEGGNITILLINDKGTSSTYTYRLFTPFLDAVCAECGEELNNGLVFTTNRKAYCLRCAENLRIDRCRCCGDIKIDVKYKYLRSIYCLECYSSEIIKNPLIRCSHCTEEVRQKDSTRMDNRVFCNNCINLSAEGVYLRRLTNAPLNYFLRRHSNNNPRERTFGVELEVNSKNINPVIDFEPFFKELTANGVRPLLFAQHDGSLDRHLGVEFDTIILKGEEGRAALRKIVRILNKYFTTDTRCGLHIHIGVNDLNDKGLKSLYYIYANIEKYLKLYVAPHRWTSEWAQRQCAKIKPIIKESLKGTNIIQESFERHRSVNFEAVREHGTLEIRLMEGNLDIDKIIHWILFHMQIINYVAENQRIIDDDKYVVGKNLKNIFGAFYEDLRTRLRVQSNKDAERKKRLQEKKISQHPEAYFVDEAMWRF